MRTHIYFHTSEFEISSCLNANECNIARHTNNLRSHPCVSGKVKFASRTVWHKIRCKNDRCGNFWRQSHNWCRQLKTDHDVVNWMHRRRRPTTDRRSSFPESAFRWWNWKDNCRLRLILIESNEIAFRFHGFEQWITTYNFDCNPISSRFNHKRENNYIVRRIERPVHNSTQRTGIQNGSIFSLSCISL